MKNAYVWKRILNEGCTYDLGSGEEEKIVNQVITSQIIVDSRAGHLSDDSRIKWCSFNRMAIPFGKTWIEGYAGEHNQHWGCLLWAEKRAAGGWDMSCWAFVGGGEGPCCVGFLEIPLDATASVIHDGSEVISGVKGSLSDHMLRQYSREQVQTTICTIVGMAFDVLTMLGCKNVQLEPRENDPKATRRAAKRFGGTPDSYRYHVLTVRPAGSKPGTTGEEIGVMPRHVCRGHFAEYGPEFGKGLLFGQYAGRFYIPPHMKGKKENGIVEKDYQIGERKTA